MPIYNYNKLITSKLKHKKNMSFTEKFSNKSKSYQNNFVSPEKIILLICFLNVE